MSKNIDNSKDLSDIFDNEDDAVNNLSFTLNQEKLTLADSVDIKTLSKYDEPSIAEINNCINIKVQYNGKEIGELKAHEIADERYAYIYSPHISISTDVGLNFLYTDYCNPKNNIPEDILCSVIN